MTDFSKLLNPEQCAAATAGEGPLLVLAAAVAVWRTGVFKSEKSNSKKENRK